MKEIILAESAGFCFGVSRSVELAQKLLSKSGDRCYSLGELIHNESVVEKLKAQGLSVAKNADEIPDGARAIIRSHGISKAEFVALTAKASEVIDATCPKVKHIHRLVEDASKNGRIPVVIGSTMHPEVVAIIGWCDNALVFSEPKDFEKWLKSDDENRHLPLSVVLQTTQTKRVFEESEKIIKKLCTNSKLFDTICSATSVRQNEAESLSRRCDAMIVIGARHSANSVHLVEICSDHCDRVQFVSRADELNLAEFKIADTIGITAGASTPLWIIKEVKQTMTDEIKVEEATSEQEIAITAPLAEETAQEVVETAPEAEAVSEPVEEVEMTFDQMLEESIKTINNGDTVIGIVAAVTATEISVDLGTKHSGYILVHEFTDDSDIAIEDLIKVGDSIEAVAVRVNDVEGTVMLSKKRLDAAKNWVLVEDAVDNGTILEGIVTEENKGGVVVTVKGIRVFVPASQTGLPREAEMSEILKQKVRLKIKEVNRQRRRVVGSIREVQRDERRESSDKIWNNIEAGKRFNGTVKSLTSYGAFVDIGGIDGMVHISELSWSRVRQPSDVLSVGQELEVYVINFDKENRKISLGYKDPNGNPWSKFIDTYKVDDVAQVKIVKLMPFGAFAELMPGVDGLIHISQIADRRIGKPDEALTVGEIVDAKISAIDNDNQKISLSIRALIAPEPVFVEEVVEQAPPAPRGDALVYEVSATGEATGFAPESDSK